KRWLYSHTTQDTSKRSNQYYNVNFEFTYLFEKNTNQPPVLILHGFLQCAEAWVISGDDHALPFYLSDCGRDVWLGNVRLVFILHLNHQIHSSFLSFNFTLYIQLILIIYSLGGLNILTNMNVIMQNQINF